MKIIPACADKIGNTAMMSAYEFESKYIFLIYPTGPSFNSPTLQRTLAKCKMGPWSRPVHIITLDLNDRVNLKSKSQNNNNNNIYLKRPTEGVSEYIKHWYM